jgi:hypothetical protein
VSKSPPQSQRPAFYQAIGHAVTRWAQVEAALARVFVIVSTCHDEQIANAIFYSPRDFSERVSITRNSCRLFLKKSPLLKEWETLRTSLIKESEVRNAIAHFMLHNILSPTPGFSGLWLMPDYFNPNEAFESRKTHARALDVLAIREAAQRFNALTASLHGFAQKIPRLKELDKL